MIFGCKVAPNNPSWEIFVEPGHNVKGISKNHRRPEYVQLTYYDLTKILSGEHRLQYLLDMKAALSRDPC